MIRLLTTLIGVGVFCAGVMAQNISPSPNAAALESFSEVPVSLYTGIPSINVPIYNLSSRHLSVPVSLSYHYTGLKPNEQTSWVGLGWALSAGGVITRTVRGKPDELSSIGYHAIKNQLKMEYVHEYTGNDATKLAQAEQEWAFLKNIANGQYDGQPDVFSFNVAGYTGKFFLEKQSDGSFKAYTIPYQNVKIELQGGFPSGTWKITVPNGTQYTFGGSGSDAQGNTISLEELSTSGGTPGVGTYTSAWYLKEIKSMNGDDDIQFQYQVENPINSYQVLYSEARQFLKPGNDASTCATGLTPVSISASEVTVTNRLHIARIVTQTKHEIIFEEGAQRQDYGDKTLGRVLVKSRTGELIKVVNLTYDYLDNGTGFKRLLLTKVQEVNGKQPVIAPSVLPTNSSELDYKGSYDFTYNTNMTGVFSVDNNFVRSIDYWGYFNGANNTTLVPSHNDPAFDLFFAGANREVNPDAVKIGALVSINNPTGGTTTLDWESNQYNTENGCNSVIKNEETIAGTGANFRKGDPGEGDTKEYTFVVDSEQPVKMMVNIVNSQPGVTIPDVVTYVKLFKVTGGGIRTEVFNANQNQTKSILLKAGTYVIEAHASAPSSFMPDNFSVTASLQCFYLNKTLVNDGKGCTKAGPGLRIAKITYADGLNQKNDIVKEYRYQSFDKSKVSSGKLMMPIQIYQNSTSYIKKPIQPGVSNPLDDEATCNYLTLSSESFRAGGYAKGSPVCYTNVTVLDGFGGNNGRTDYYYSFQNDATADFGPQEDLDWLRGHLLEKRVYDAYGRELTRSLNHYEGSATDASQPQFHQLIGVAARVTSTSTADPDDRASFKNVVNYAPFNLTSAWHRLVRTENFSYFYDKGDFAGNSKKSMKTEKLFFYDNPTQHTFVTRTQTTDSEGRIVVTKSRYPQDILPGEAIRPMAEDMIGKYYIGSPIVSYTLRNNEVLGASFQEYDLTSNNKLYPVRSYVAEFNQPLATEGEVFNKDGNGNYVYLQKKVDVTYENYTSNVVATTPNKDITSAVIWNSKHDLVIARAVNADPGQIAYTSFEETDVVNEGQWAITSATTSSQWQTTKVHTGMQALYAESAKIELKKNNLLAGSTYKVSFWIHPNNQSTVNPVVKSSALNIATLQQTVSRPSGWLLYEATITLVSDTEVTLEIPQGVYVDEVRFHPVQTRMATFNHRTLVGLVSQTGANHQTVYYEYDGLKRLRIVKDFDGNIIKRHTYKYKKVD
ncbi:hypothetical protein BKI52_35375 [marine bacterium AO1-C]|nr:hypothetical protein BKI52_35375 [marine bacterium AO1-C]